MKKHILTLLFVTIVLIGFSQRNCDPPQNLTSNVIATDVTLQWNSPQMSQFLVLSEGSRDDDRQFFDSSPWYTEIYNSASLKDYLDVQFTFPCHFSDGEAGIESDGQFIYTAKWQGSRFACYNFDGSIQDSFDIAGVNQVRDMAFCEIDGLMYGTEPSSGGNSRIYKMDFNTRTLLDIFYIEFEVRTLAYDPDLDVFYSNNWSSDVMTIDRQTGAILNTTPLTGTYGFYYGFAYDNWSAGGPFLWGFSQDGSGSELVQLALPDFNETGLVIDVSSLDTSDVVLAGGLFTQPGIIEGEVTLGGLIQNKVIFGLELADISPPPPNSVLAGYSVYRDGSLQNTDLITDSMFIDPDLNPGEYQYQVTAVYTDTLGSIICESSPAGPVTSIIEAPLALGGNVFAGTAKLDDGMARAYMTDGNTAALSYTTEIDNYGYYFFHNCQVSDYYLLCQPVPNSAFYESYIPTYYGDVYHWENSNTILLQANMYNADINLIQLVSSNTGSGRISGRVYLENKGILSPPAADVQFLLLNSNNECIAMKYSNTEGYFSFNELANGTYKLLCEITGKKMSPQIIVINDANPFSDGINFIVNEEEIVIGITENLPPGVLLISNIYPNPAVSSASIDIAVLKNELVKVSAFSPAGVIFNSFTQKLDAGLNKIKLSTEELPPGIYFINLKFHSNYQITRRFIVVN